MTDPVSRPHWRAIALGIGLIASGSVIAQTLDAIVDEGQAKLDAAQKSQQKIDTIVDAQQQRLITYRALLKQAEGLQQYNEQLSTQIEGQQALLERFDQSIDQVAKIERQMLPLIDRMAGGLAAFVDLDLPFHEAERMQRLEFINAALAKADVDVAEKFRQVIEAYQVETEYGRKIDAYQDIIELDGKPQEVDVLRFGRIALVAQTKDASTTAVWDQANKRWEELDAGTYRNSIRRGILMAKKQASIDLVMLPIQAPEVAQ
jgi:hypothetical protein